MLCDPTRTPQVDSRVVIARLVSFHNDGHRVRTGRVYKGGQGDDPLIVDASGAIEDNDAREIGALVPQFGRPRRLREEMRDDLVRSERRARNSDAEARLCEVAGQHPRVVPEPPYPTGVAGNPMFLQPDCALGGRACEEHAGHSGALPEWRQRGNAVLTECGYPKGTKIP